MLTQPMRIIITGLFLFAYTSTFSQPNIEMLTRLKAAPRDTATVRLYGTLSKFYTNTKPDSATYYIGEGLQLAKDLKYKMGEGMMLNQLGVVNEVHGNSALAEKYQLNALAIFKELKDPYTIATCENGIGVVEAKKGNYTTATNYFLDALQLFKSIKHKPGIIQTYIKLGTVNDYNGNADKALEYYNLATALNGKDTLSNAYYSLLNNIGIVYGRKNQFKKALDYFEQGIKSSNTPRFIDLHITLLSNAMKACAELGENEKSLVYHNLAIAKARQYNIPEQEARELINFADVQKDNPTLAVTYLNQALLIAQTINNRPIIADIYQALQLVYKKQKNYPAAYEALEHFHNLQDSLFNITKTRELATLFASYELNESKNRIHELQLQNKERSAERNLFIISTLGILIIVSLLWYYYRKMNVLNEKLQAFNKIKDKLFSIIGHDLKAPVSGLVQTLELLESGALNEEESKEMIGELKKQTGLSLNTLNALLNWGETQLKGIAINPKQITTKEIIEKNLAIAESQAAAKSITITDNTSSEIQAFVDVDHFDFIIRNLLSNAIKFTNNHGKVEINSTDNKDNNMVVFSVKDTGKGIGVEEQKQFSISNIHVSFGTNGEKGTGLGLLLAKEFVQANEGKIWLESKQGEGTIFYVAIKKHP